MQRVAATAVRQRGTTTPTPSGRCSGGSDSVTQLPSSSGGEHSVEDVVPAESTRGLSARLTHATDGVLQIPSTTVLTTHI